MGKTARKPANKEARTSSMQTTMIPLLGLSALLKEELRSFVAGVGLQALQVLLEQERTAVCGARYERGRDREARRNGHAPSSLVLGGRRVRVRRPRARTEDGAEVVLPSWEAFANEDPLNRRAVEQMVVGVSTRKYRRSLEDLPVELDEHGTSKSAVSRRFVARTSELAAAAMKRDLSHLSLAVLMIDGIHIGEHVMLVALGVDEDGTKHVLGLHEGATENATACTALLTELRDRGMKTDHAILVVIDGAKALRSAVTAVFGERALVQRCQVHKARNVAEHLPKNEASQARAVLRKAYGSGDAEKAKKLLTGLARQLEKRHPSAAASIREGLSETLTVMDLDLPRALERTLSTTNAIENLMGSVRHTSRRVKRWRDGAMIERWTSTALDEASKKFRRLRGHGGMKKLVRLLRERDADASQLAKKQEAA